MNNLRVLCLFVCDTTFCLNFTAQKINDSSLKLLEESDLIDLGIEKGPRLLILKIVEKLQQFEENDAEPEAEPGPSNKLSRQLFEADEQFRCNILPILDQGIIPLESDLKSVTKIACQPMMKRVWQGHGYPSVQEQDIVAKEIVTLFPQLKYDNIRPAGAPDEWMFFWPHSGLEVGGHNGLIFNHIRNSCKRLPEGMRKFKRAKPDIQTSVPSEIIARAEALRSVEAYDRSKICTEMEACFPLHKMFLQEKKTIDDFVEMFPHLIEFRGLLINHTFLRLFPTCEPRPDYKGVLAKCLLYSADKFISVEDQYIRALLRINDQMPTRGVRRKVNGSPSMDETNAVEHLVRWIKPSTSGLSEYMVSMSDDSRPHIVCTADPMKAGPLYVILNKRVSVAVRTSIHAIDIFFRCFAVFGIPVPVDLIMLTDFLAMTLYKTRNQSSRKTVMKLAALFQESAEAEG